VLENSSPTSAVEPGGIVTLFVVSALANVMPARRRLDRRASRALRAD
jgi:hypothetical protein